MKPTRKKVLILSQEPWSFLFLSKQNYAVALRQKGYEVFFLTFPSKRLGWEFNISKDPTGHDINLIAYSLPLPHFLMFKAKGLYKIINKLFLKFYLIRGHRDNPFTLAIDFGLYHYLFNSMNWTGAIKKVFFPVDNSDLLPKRYPGADMIVSVSDLILNRFKNSSVPVHFLNHGLASEYAEQATKNLVNNTHNYPVPARVRLGYIGNLNIAFLDKELLKSLILALPKVDFIFYGKLEKEVDPEWYEFITNHKNVFFKGQKQTAELSTLLQEMDGFLLCYSRECNESISGNSHKILEYLSTGKVIFTTYIKMYESFKFIEMCPQDARDTFIDMVKSGVNNITTLNIPDMRNERIEFSLSNTYINNVNKIESWLGI
ncbi:MAG: hypothetical protein KA143_00450 [Saprospiraceae bacterium]|nr:hypothetical protein [Saprospiraceae bacterium]